MKQAVYWAGDRLIDWMSGCLKGWLLDSTVDFLTEWMNGWMNVWQTKSRNTNLYRDHFRYKFTLQVFRKKLPVHPHTLIHPNHTLIARSFQSGSEVHFTVVEDERSTHESRRTAPWKYRQTLFWITVVEGRDFARSLPCVHDVIDLSHMESRLVQIPQSRWDQQDNHIQRDRPKSRPKHPLSPSSISDISPGW